MSDKTNEAGDSNLAADLASLREDISRLSESLAGLVRGRADSASATIKGVMGDTTSQFSQATASAQDSALSAAAGLERRIEQNPLTAVLIAAAVGFALGAMTRRG